MGLKKQINRKIIINWIIESLPNTDARFKKIGRIISEKVNYVVRLYENDQCPGHVIGVFTFVT